MRSLPRSQSPLNNWNVSVPKSVLELEFIFTLKKVKTQVQTQPSKLQLSWITTEHLPHPDLFPFAATRDGDKKAELSHMHRTQECANDFHMTEMKIFSKIDT